MTQNAHRLSDLDWQSCKNSALKSANVNTACGTTVLALVGVRYMANAAKLSGQDPKNILAGPRDAMSANGT
jgi:hypothetical protein